MHWIKWHLLNLIANIRGWLWRWPQRPATPCGYSAVSCGFRNWREARDMYQHGWVPWCVQRTTDGAIARQFIVKVDPAELAANEQRDLEHYLTCNPDTAP